MAKRLSGSGPARKRVNGSQKGGEFERQMAKALSLWVSAGASRDLFWRTASSGGRSTRNFKKTGAVIDAQVSDIAPIHKDAEPFASLFVLECKSYATIMVHQVVLEWPGSLIAKWWGQVCRDASRAGKAPLLVVKGNRMPALVVLEAATGLAVFDGKPPVYLPKAGVCMVPLAEVLALPFATFRARHVTTQRTPALPRARLLRPAPDRQGTRRVPLVDL